MIRAFALPWLTVLWLFTSLCSEANAGVMFQTGEWKITRIKGIGQSHPSCQATTTFIMDSAWFGDWKVSLQANENQSAILRVQMENPDPDWVGELKEYPDKTVDNCRYWFSDGAKHSMKYILEGRIGGGERYEINSYGRFLDDLSRSRTISVTRQPEAAGSEEKSTLAFENGDKLSGELRACIASLGTSGSYPETIISNQPQTSTVLVAPISKRLEAARKALAEAKFENDPLRESALLQAGHASADALRMQEARDYFAFAKVYLNKGGGLRPDIRRGLERLVEVLILSEQLDEALKIASSLPDNERFLGAIAVAKGDFKNGAKHFYADATRIQGRQINSMSMFMPVKPELPPVAANEMSARMRELLLLWGIAGLGQEEQLIGKNCENCFVTLTDLVPPSIVVSQVFTWLDSTMLRDGAPEDAGHRRDLGIALYLRGASLLRAGYLQSVETDLASSRFELKDGSGADGWAWRTETALAELAAAQGQTIKALDMAQTAANKMAGDIGKESLPWIEASSLVSELASRLGDHARAAAQAREVISVSSKCLPRTHSLVIRLKRVLAEELYAQKKTAEALTVGIEAIGISRAPVLAAAPYVELHKKYFGMAKGQNSGFKVAKDQQDQLINAIGLSGRPKDTTPAALPEIARLAYFFGKIENTTPDKDLARGLQILIRVLLDGNPGAINSGFTFSFDSYAKALLSLTRGFSASIYNNTSTDPNALYFPIQTQTAMHSTATAWLSLPSMFPGYLRQSLTPGPEYEGMEILFRNLEQLKGPISSMGPKAGFNLIDESLIHFQVASRGEVLANMMIREELGQGHGNAAIYDKEYAMGRQLVAADIWFRRQRAIISDSIQQAGEIPPPPGATRAAVRRTIANMWGHVLELGNKFTESYYSPTNPVDFKSILSNPTAIDSKQLQSKLKDNEAIIAWLPLANTTQLAVISKNTTKMAVIDQGAASLEKPVRAIREAFSKAWKDRQNAVSVPFPVNEAYALYRELFGPIERDLAGVTHIYTVQIGVTGAVPLGLLVTQPAEKGGQPAWLNNRFAITRLPALVNPKQLEKTKPKQFSQKWPLLAIGDPVLKGPAGQVSSYDDTSIHTISDIDNLDRLENTAKEIQAVAKALGLPGGVTDKHILSGSKATPKEVQEKLGRKSYQYLLFATHGLNGGGVVGEPALVLSPSQGQRKAEDSGLLRASDIVKMDIDTDLVILSACESSTSMEPGSEPLAGLASSFLIAGARSVLATHWKVFTDASEKITTETINVIKQKNLPAAVALQRAIQRIRSQAPPGSLEATPYYWAPFEMSGFLK